MNIVVQDANILIDLLNAELLDLFFQLPCDNHITDLVLAEIQTPKLSASQKKKLTSHSLDPTELNEVLGLRQDAHKLSIPDCSVVWLSQQLGLSTILLSGDTNYGVLPKVKKSKFVGYFGFLMSWLIMDMFPPKRWQVFCRTAHFVYHMMNVKNA